MRVSLASHGGMAAAITSRLPPRVLDADRLPRDAAQELRRLVAAATADPGGAAPSPRARDAMTYTVTIDDGPRSTTLTASDTTMSAAFGELVAWLDQRIG
ncbi:hypothetical protein ACWT_2907 [Actinoplanes sp. SE50]|uniref:protealysin inhibitor emfourin n=1 Tax=unclassified Actinoplanes TaxID=2626549 RepID=UPI00023EC0AA|nr:MULTISPECIES: protealysin inhibitor emfourin [unclassified Actinoplanes]AEV83534.1 hypothetical protein ACPL_2639 [Actinoplanes sp. SE50/110]ATO82322.1 hypothetical protein ACWT_2907 [Actinoplanes sp. SE50]SLL99729.1 hypothetical protein ACSP50_2960 [Actinoplanes sp. SE50/110]